MSSRVKFGVVSFVFGASALLLTPVLFPVNPATPAPAPGLIPFFLLLAVFESIFFGVGIAFLAFGLPLMRRVADVAGISPWPAFLAIGWLTASWWPHLGMHRVVGLDLEKLIVVDYGFHLPYILAAGFVAHFFIAVVTSSVRVQERVQQRYGLSAVGERA